MDSNDLKYSSINVILQQSLLYVLNLISAVFSAKE